MSIVISSDVFCDRCANWIHGATGPKPKPCRARKVARAGGWQRVRVGTGYEDVCPWCQRTGRKAAEGDPHG